MKKILLLLTFIGAALSGRAATFTLGTSSLVVGSGAGSNTVVLGASPAGAAWTNTANSPWLHLPPGYATGTGSTNVVFSFDANPFPTRAGTLTIAGQTLTVTQASASYEYVPAQSPAPIAITNIGSAAYALAADAAGNVYFAQPGLSAVGEWVAASNTLVTIISGLNLPDALALDKSGNLYVGDELNQAVYEWAPGLNSSNVITVFTNASMFPSSMAIDGSGNIYVANGGGNYIDEWSPANSNFSVVLGTPAGIHRPNTIAADAAGNLYLGSFGIPGTNFFLNAANSNLTVLFTNAVGGSVINDAVDGSGNFYVTSGSAGEVWELFASNNLAASLYSFSGEAPGALTVNGNGDVFESDFDSNNLVAFPRAYVFASNLVESAAAGSDALPPVLPTTELLTGPFAPSSDQNWLTITGVTNGVVSFSFTTNSTGAPRTAQINTLNISATVTQEAAGAASQPLLLVFHGTNEVTNGQEFPPVDFGAVQQHLTNVLTFSISNSGGQALDIGTPQMPSGFILASPPPGAMSPGSNGTFTVQVDSSAIGTNTGDITISNNNATNNSFVFAVTAAVIADEPQFQLFQGATAITNGQAAPINFGSLQQSFTGPIETFTITNPGGSALTVSAPTLPTGFTLVTNPPASINPGSSGGFSVQLNTSAVGTNSGVVSIVNGDPTNTPFHFSITGAVTAELPVLEVWQGANAISNGQAAAVNFGTNQQGANATVITFAVSNLGAAALDAGGLTVPTGFSVVSNLPPSVAGLSHGSFSVQLDTTAIGAKSGAITFSNNDATQTPFSFPVSGSILGKIISVNGSLIFGGTALNSTSAPQTFVISNGGNEALTVSNIIYPQTFALSWTNGSIPAGSNQVVSVTFSPVAPTNYGGLITVLSDATMTNGSASVSASGYGASGNLTVIIITNGLGSVTPDLAGKAFGAGSKHTIKAVPGSGYVFAYWSGSTNTAANPLTFVMLPSTLLEANFVTNPFPPVKGSYNGLFAPASGATAATSGMLKNLTVSSTGGYSGALVMAGASHAVSGTFGVDLQATNVIKRPASQGGNLVLTMSLDPVPPPQMTGSVSASGFNAPLTAFLATNLPPAEYSLLILPDTNHAPPVNSPGGEGYALITNSAGTAKNPASATARITGALADGTAFSQSVPVSADGYVPVYASLYANQGLLLGWINLMSTNTNGIGLTWIRPGTKTGLYDTGFTNVLGADGIAVAGWTNPGNYSLLTNISWLDTIGVTNNAEYIPITVTPSGMISGIPQRVKVSGAIAPKTGLITVTIGSGATKVTGHGVMLNATNGGGYIATKTASEVILLTH